MPFIIPSWALGAAVILIAIQVGRAISGRHGMSRWGRWGRRGRAGREELGSDTDVDELRQSLETMQHRVAELEERVDFAERLLAKHRESDRLGQG
jgi:hypothetical protein